MSPQGFLETIDRNGGRVGIRSGKVHITGTELSKDLLAFMNEHNDAIVDLLAKQLGKRGLVTFVCRTCLRRANSTAMPGPCKCSARFWQRTGFSMTDLQGQPIPVVIAECDVKPLRMTQYRCVNCKTSFDEVLQPKVCRHCGLHEFMAERSWWERLMRWNS